MSSKRSFIIHKDSLSVLDDLDDEQAGKLFKAIKAYHEGVIADMDSLTRIAFSPFRAQFERDLEKYNKIVNRNRNNGLNGGRPKSCDNPDEPKKPSGLFANPDNPQKADSGSGSGSGSEKPVSSPRGSRLPDDWVIPGEWIEWAVDEKSVNRRSAENEAERFGDYWRAQPGSKGVKANWRATWQNWIRSAIDRNPQIVQKVAGTRRAFGE